MVVLDTHALLWWVDAPAMLGPRARRAIGRAERLGVPTIVFWEIALLTRRRRLDLGRPVSVWTEAVLTIPRIEPLPLTTEIALRADALPMHADPADRFIVATAIAERAPLLTKDELLRPLRLVRTLW